MDDIWSGEPNIVLDGKYRIEALLGQVGMGAVYRATHLGTTRTVAVKIIQPRFSQDPEFVEDSAAKRKRLAVCATRTWWTRGERTAIMTAQLYLKARHAGGEKVETA